MTSNASAPDSAIVSPDSVRQCVQAVLRAAQAQGWTDARLGELSGVAPRAIKSYRLEGKEPSLSNALSLCVVLGPKALNAILALIGHTGRPLDEGDEFCANTAVATGLKHFATIAEAAADGHIDHIEAPICKEAADQIIATVIPLSSAGEAA